MTCKVNLAFPCPAPSSPAGGGTGFRSLVLLLPPQSGFLRRGAYRDFHTLGNCYRFYGKHWETSAVIDFTKELPPNTIVIQSEHTEQYSNNWHQWKTIDNNGKQWTIMDNNVQQSVVLHVSLMLFFLKIKLKSRKCICLQRMFKLNFWLFAPLVQDAQLAWVQSVVVVFEDLNNR